MPISPILATVHGRLTGRIVRACGRPPALAALFAAALFWAVPAAAAPQLAERGGQIERLMATMEAKSAFFRIIFEDHPGERALFIRELKAARRFGGRESMMIAAVGFGARMGWKYFPYYYSRTDADAVLAYARLMEDTLTMLRLGSHDDCYDFLAGTPDERARVNKQLSRREKRRMVRVMNGVVVGSRRAKRPPRTDPNAYRQPLQAVVQRVADRLGRENLVRWKPGLTGDDRAKACNFAIAFFEEALKGPRQQSVLVLRAVFGE